MPWGRQLGWGASLKKVRYGVHNGSQETHGYGFVWKSAGSPSFIVNYIWKILYLPVGSRCVSKDSWFCARGLVGCPQGVSDFWDDQAYGGFLSHRATHMETSSIWIGFSIPSSYAAIGYPHDLGNPWNPLEPPFEAPIGRFQSLTSEIIVKSEEQQHSWPGTQVSGSIAPSFVADALCSTHQKVIK